MLNNFEDLMFILDTIYIWTDGSACVKNGLGGIGVYIRYRDFEKKIRMGFKNTKTGRCEIKAVITALYAITDKSKQIIIYSDSQYVIKSITIWMENWSVRGWLGVANVDLWKQFLQIYNQFDKSKIQFVHVKGHTEKDDWKSLGNAVADELACYKTQEIQLENDLIIFKNN